MQTLEVSEEIPESNSVLIQLLKIKPENYKIDLGKILPKSTLLLALFPSEDRKEMQQSIIELNNNRKYLLVFTSLEILNKWNKNARPLPMDAREIARNVGMSNIDGFIIDINEDYRYKIQNDFCEKIYKGLDWFPLYKNDEFKQELSKIMSEFKEIEDFEILDSDECSAKIVFYSSTDITTQIIELSKKINENSKIQSIAPQGLDLFVAPR